MQQERQRLVSIGIHRGLYVFHVNVLYTTYRHSLVHWFAFRVCYAETTPLSRQIDERLAALTCIQIST